MSTIDCCKDCHLPEERKLLREGLKFCCCECSRRSEEMAKEYYDQKWKNERRAFVRLLREDPKNIRVFTSKLRELNDQLDELKAARYTIYQTTTENYYEELKKEFETMRIEKKIAWISQMLKETDLAKKICQGKLKEIDDAMMLEAKAIPINLFIKSAEDKHGSERSVFVCPLHGEKTGSFTWYKRQNKWHCFGCGKNGDAIDLYMALNNVPFTKAVRELAEGRY